MRIIAAVVAATVLAIPASAGPTQSAKEQKVRKLIALTGGENLGRQMLDQMAVEFSRMDLPAGLPEKFREIAQKEDIVSLYVPIYLKHLEEKDIDAAIKFFSSPAGRALTSKQPAIMQESMLVGQKWGADVMERAKAELRKENAAK